MPEFPAGPDITREQALDMILASIAMEELGLSHIINAEGEKLQYVLGTLKGGACGGSGASTCELLEVNKSVTRLLERVQENQLLLKGKLERVLEAIEPCRPPCPPPTPCGECGRGEMLLLGAETPCPWQCGRPLPWTCCCRGGRGASWSPADPGAVRLCSGAWSLQLSLQFRFAQPCGGAVVQMESVEGDHCRPLFTWSVPGGGEGEGRRISECCLLPPDRGGESRTVTISLRGPEWVCLEDARLHAARICG